ncbi:MAG: hypothetical protein LAT68_15430 [Cyclobacteriaceae bacterium]|nr:hypothetical protein [Cyclobacteriaceae bacterium]
MACDKKDPKVVEGADPSGRRLLDFRAQNPAPVSPEDQGAQDFYNRIQDVTDRIMRTFTRTLPSNYVSRTDGPLYTVQFRAAVEVLARFQVFANEVYENTDFDFTRPEFLYQTLGILVFPDTDRGIPDVDGDVTYREFLKKMVDLLLKGSTPEVVRQGSGLLTEALVTLHEKFRFDYRGDISKALQEQFGFELFYSKTARTSPQGPPSHYHVVDIDCDGNGVTTSTVCLPGHDCVDHTHVVEDYRVLPGSDPVSGHDHVLLPEFPQNPFVLEENVVKILDALKPAHTLYDYRLVFREVFGRYVEREVFGGEGMPIGDVTGFTPGVFDDESRWKMLSWYYDDFRKFCLGAKEVTGSGGETWADRTLFSDPGRSFRYIRPQASLRVLTGPNAGTYTVREVLTFPILNDPTPRPYATSGGLSGNLVVESGTVVDPGQDFAQAVSGETLTILSGPNAGTYRLSVVEGINGGPVGSATGPSDRVRVDSTLLRVDRRMPAVASGQEYAVDVDRLGQATFRSVSGELASQFFYI